MPTFLVTGIVHGTWSRFVDAENESAARDKIEAEIEEDDWTTEVEDVEDVDVAHVQRVPSE